MNPRSDPIKRLRHPYFRQAYLHQLEMIRPAGAGLAQVPQIPADYLLRQFRSGEERDYDELFHLAFEDQGRFQEILARTLPGGFFVIEYLPSRQLVASCVAFRGSSSPRHPDSGQLGWLVTDPAHTRQGLGTIVAASVTNRLIEEGYSLTFLGTEDERHGAIAIYLNLGWRPYIYGEGMELRWRNIFAALGRTFDAQSS